MERAWRIEYEGGLLGKSIEPKKVLEKAAGILNFDLDDIRHLRAKYNPIYPNVAKVEDAPDSRRQG